MYFNVILTGFFAIIELIQMYELIEPKFSIQNKDKVSYVIVNLIPYYCVNKNIINFALS